MKKILLSLSLMLGMMFTSNLRAQSLGDIFGGLGGGDIGSLAGNLLDGIFTKTDLTLADLTGEYVSQGPAVTFKSDNFLQKAGGLAGAAAIESKLDPYYKQYGLDGMQLTIDTEANFTMTVKGMNLKGTITKNNDGTFAFNFKVVGINLGKFTAYIEKSGSNLDLMFDASKLVSIISAIAKFTGNSMATTLSSLLDSYDGACIGFKMVSTSANTSSGAARAVSSGLDALKGILNKGN